MKVKLFSPYLIRTTKKRLRYRNQERDLSAVLHITGVWSVSVGGLAVDEDPTVEVLGCYIPLKKNDPDLHCK